MRRFFVLCSVFIALMGLSSCEVLDTSTKGLLKYEVIKPNSVQCVDEGKVEFLDVFNVSVTYKNAKGEMRTLENINLPWHYSEEIKTPFEAEIRTKITLKQLATYPTVFPEPYRGGITGVYITCGDIEFRGGGGSVGTGNSSWSQFLDGWLRAYGDETYKLLFSDEELERRGYVK